MLKVFEKFWLTARSTWMVKLVDGQRFRMRLKQARQRWCNCCLIKELTSTRRTSMDTILCLMRLLQAMQR
uniref:Uncharacterized protein n=1 Tax=Globisporangium ultimum (strain ATCC 200006 / CBS 805.95 / DAOM BR144) TaxID=431595 RepID=K3WM50_GLOUD